MAYLKAHFDAIFLTGFYIKSRCIVKEARNLNFYQIYQLNVASYMYNISKQGKYPMLNHLIVYLTLAITILRQIAKKLYCHFPEVNKSGWISNINLSKSVLMFLSLSWAKDRTRNLRMLFRNSVLRSTNVHLYWALFFFQLFTFSSYWLILSSKW